MFLPFKISSRSLSFLGYKEDVLYQHADADKEEHIDQLREYLFGTDGIIDGDRLSKLWFPHEMYDVFISHSHSDLNKAHFLACWLETNCGLKCFIDADVWGNAFALLNELDRTHCRYRRDAFGVIYDYEEHNLCTSHVFSMLSIALMEAIDNIECPIFIETGNSVPLKSTIQEKTLSPWIFEEVNFMNKLPRKRPIWLYNTRYFSADDRGILLEKAQDSLKISHSIPTKGLVGIGSANIKCMKGHTGKFALKALYRSKFFID